MPMGPSPWQQPRVAAWPDLVSTGLRCYLLTSLVALLGVVLGANPLDDIDNTRRIERVMKGGRFIRLGYSPEYTRPQAPIRAIPSTPEPEISGITPNAVAEGSPNFEMTVEGVGFIGESVVRVDGVSVPTTCVNIRTVKATIPASVVARAFAKTSPIVGLLAVHHS